MAEVEARVTANTLEAIGSLTWLQREGKKVFIRPIVDAWCPDLNQYAKEQFIQELFDALL